MKIVIDKSYLRGAGQNAIKDLCTSHEVMMPEILLYELLTAEAEDRAQCFRNLPAIQNPLVLVKNVGAVIRAEIKSRTPVVNTSDIFINKRYEFNRRLIYSDFEFTTNQKISISVWQKDIKSRIEDFKQKAATVSGWFPKIIGFRPNANPTPIDEAKRLICTDKNVVRAIYNQTRQKDFPETDTLDEKWALFREIQVYIMATLDYVRKYGDGNSDAISKGIENEYCDLEYCITALLFGALASRDNQLVTRFKCITPDGFVIH